MDVSPAQEPRLEQRRGGGGKATGQMTSVMRAMSLAATGPRVLRIGVVRAGRVVEERIIKQRMTVTIGSSEESTFVLAARAIPPRLALFELIGDEYFLNVPDDGLKGRIALPAGLTDLQTLCGQRVKLTDDARGKVVVGETTLLFQFVAAPPVQPRPQLPLAVKGGLATNNDWALTFIAAFSFLIHFGIVGAMYSDWSDPIVDDSHAVAGLVDMVGRIPLPPVDEPDKSVAVATPTAKPTVTPPATTPTAGPKTHGETATGPGVKSPSPPGPSNPSNEKTSDEKAAALAARGAAMQMQIVAGMNDGPAVKGALDRSNAPIVDLGSAAEANTGVVRGNGDLKTTAGGPVQASRNGGLAVLGGGIKADGTKNAGPATVVDGPIAVAKPGAPQTSVPIPGVEVTVANLRGRFRSCYQTGLDTDSTMAGKVLVSARVGPNGEVSSADIVSISGLSASVGQCIAGVVKRATFSAPGGGGSTVQIPVTFVQSK